uniref:Putative xylanase/chitin deacetylase n=1 Tax=Desulfovibrio sp. U5L TaxID=596152 RepID=I2Q7K4_9BACT
MSTCRVLILLYHRVATLPSDPQLLAVRPEHFEAHLEVMRTKGMEFSRLVDLNRPEAWSAGDRVVISFDDGYADNASAAAPILVRHGVPATFFVASDHLDGQRWFWWDEVEALLLGPGSGADVPPAAPWNMLSPPRTRAQAAYRTACLRLRAMPRARRERVLENLRRSRGGSVQPPEPWRAMTSRELRDLERPGLLEVGGHTCGHALLAAESEAVQRTEIESDKSVLEGLLGHSIHAFSYPYGAPGDFTAVSRSLAAAAGYRVACANHPGLVRPETDLLSLPRNLVRDWDGPRFAAMLDAWLK